MAARKKADIAPPAAPDTSAQTATATPVLAAWLIRDRSYLLDARCALAPLCPEQGVHSVAGHMAMGQRIA